MESTTLNSLRKDGIAYAPWRLDMFEIRELVSHLTKTRVYNAHVKAKADRDAHWGMVANKFNTWPMFCHSMENIITAPYFFEYAIKGYKLALNYFDEEPVLYSMNAFWTQPGAYSYQDTHGWHRDGDDRKQLVMFMFGTDVDAQHEGAHLYQRGTHNTYDGDLEYHFTAPPSGIIEEITGKAGTCFFTDTRGLHIGIRPNKLRMLAWARWGVSSPPESYVWDQLSPVNKDLLGDRYPSDPALQNTIRLVVA